MALVDGSRGLTNKSPAIHGPPICGIPQNCPNHGSNMAGMDGQFCADHDEEIVNTVVYCIRLFGPMIGIWPWATSNYISPKVGSSSHPNSSKGHNWPFIGCEQLGHSSSIAHLLLEVCHLRLWTGVPTAMVIWRFSAYKSTSKCSGIDGVVASSSLISPMSTRFDGLPSCSPTNFPQNHLNIQEYLWFRLGCASKPRTRF